MKVVVVMPFDSDFDQVYAMIKSTVEAISARPDEMTCLRVDEDLKAAHITVKIEDNLRSADVCIADLSGLRPNVLWEVGFIEAMRKPLIVISQSDPANLPFNIKDLQVIRYTSARLRDSLVPHLTQALRETIATLGARRSTWTIAITGSRSVNPQSARNSVAALASPFLGPDTVWYCGTNGPVDEAAARFLLEAKQRVSGVYSSTHNVSPEIHAIFRSAGISLVNADHVTMPFRITDLSARDAFLVATDLCILILDNEASHSKFLHDWLTAHHKNHLVGFA